MCRVLLVRMARMPTPKKRYRVALLFEYSTLNGGERSMLACLDWLRIPDSDIEFVAIEWSIESGVGRAENRDHSLVRDRR